MRVIVATVFIPVHDPRTVCNPNWDVRDGFNIQNFSVNEKVKFFEEWGAPFPLALKYLLTNQNGAIIMDVIYVHSCVFMYKYL